MQVKENGGISKNSVTFLSSYKTISNIFYGRDFVYQSDPNNVVHPRSTLRRSLWTRLFSVLITEVSVENSRTL